MNEKEQLIREIEKAPDILVKEVLNFLLFTKSRTKELERRNALDWEMQLKEMAQDREIQVEISDINQEFSIAEMDDSI